MTKQRNWLNTLLYGSVGVLALASLCFNSVRLHRSQNQEAKPRISRRNDSQTKAAADSQPASIETRSLGLNSSLNSATQAAIRAVQIRLPFLLNSDDGHTGRYLNSLSHSSHSIQPLAPSASFTVSNTNDGGPVSIGKAARDSLFGDTIGVLLRAESARPPNASSDTITYTYDSLNRLTSASYASGGTITYSYDAAGNRTSIQVTGAVALDINGVAPPAGRATGGQQIKLSGSFDNLSIVKIGGVSAAWSYTNGASEVTVTTPPHVAGAVNIDLTPTVGSPYSKSNAFAYLPTAFTDDTLLVGVTTAKAHHIIELRQAVDALRAVAGLGPAPWTDPTLSFFSTLIKAVHITELRSYLENAAALLGYPAGSYTDPGLPAGFVIKRIHIEELRQRIRTIAG